MTDPIADPTSLHASILAQMTLGESPNETVFRRAAELGIFPTVRSWLEHRGDDVSASDPGWHRHLVSHALRARTCASVVDTLQRDGLDFVVLKGLPLGRELYGDARLRQSSDIDLLVESSRRSDTIASLATLGFEPVSRLDDDHNRELELVHRDHGLLIDLHWRIAFPWVPAPSTESLLERRSTVRTDGNVVPVLGRTDRWIHLLLHFHDHVGFAKGLLDIAAFLDVHGTDVFDESLAELERLGLQGLASWPIEVMRRIGLELPDSPRVDISVRLWATWSANALAGVLRSSAPIDARHPSSFKIGAITSGEQVMLKGATMALLDRRRDRLRAMVAPVVSTPSAVARKYGRDRPSPLDWARWALRPATLVAKQLGEVADASRTRRSS